jgi:aerobic C4-dicarboxylate transport protein
MSEARALTNLVGNGVATLVVARWTGDLDMKRLHQGLDLPTLQESQDPEAILDNQVAHMVVAKSHG